jgi:hypothetical protein
MAKRRPTTDIAVLEFDKTKRQGTVSLLPDFADLTDTQQLDALFDTIATLQAYYFARIEAREAYETATRH